MEPDLHDPRLYLNRELSLLEFNRRVLAQAIDAGTPLLERLRFLTICSTNLDEFFEVRVASHRSLMTYGGEQRGPDQRSHQELLTAISHAAHQLVDEQYSVLNDVIMPELERQDIRVLKRDEWTAGQRQWLESMFQGDILPVLTPMGIDPAHPFPKILNKSLNFIVRVVGEDAFGRESGIAVVQVPRSLPRLFNLPRDVAQGPHDFVLLSSVIHAHIDQLFAGMQVQTCEQFRVTRDGDLFVDAEEVEDYLKAIAGELPERRYAQAVRLEVTDRCPDDLARFLLEKFNLGERDLYRVNGPVNLHRLEALHKNVERPELKFGSFVPRVSFRADAGDSLFDVLSRRDMLLHHPYESFTPVLELVRQAAADPDVLAIKQTLYRVGSDSPLVEALIDAARANTQVTVVIELRARFDEAENIDLATRLQEVGANVVYGIVGYKTHAKMLMIVRREGGSLRRYVHLGTGNYHAGTARAYTDFGLMTSDPAICADVDKLFTQLTGLGKAMTLERVLQSPFTLKPALLRMIDDEIAEARAGRKAWIRAKLNALTEGDVIAKLYEASCAGVRIDLIVRGACCLRPGVPGVSENIRVRSIIGRFLEHHRIYAFHAAGRELVYLSSADWMSRNLLRRVESAFPVEDPGVKQRVLREGLELPLADDLNAWELSSDGTYRRVEATARISSQETLLQEYCSPGSASVEYESRPGKGKNKGKGKGGKRKEGLGDRR